MIKRLLAATLIVSLTSCKTTTKVSSTVKVVGGTIAKPGQFPAALFIPNCSATRVGKTVVLTAAHCVTGAAIPNEDGVRKLQLKYSSDESIQIAIGTDTGKAQDVTIKEIWTEPSYLNMAGIPGAELRDLYDIALIKFHTLPPQPVAVLDPAPLDPRNAVVFTGYGCTQIPAHMRPANGSDTLAKGSEIGLHDLHWAEVKFTGYDSRMGRLTNINPYDDQLTEKQFSGCPGDSGSAVYRSHGSVKIVGVNSFINPLTTEFVRFDDGIADVLNREIERLER